MVSRRSDLTIAVLSRGALALALAAVVGASPMGAAPARASGLLQVETTVEGPYGGEETTVYDAGIHLPLIVSSPMQKKHGVVNGAMASCIAASRPIWPGSRANCRRRQSLRPGRAFPDRL